MDKNKEATPDISAFLASAVHDMKNSIGILINFLESNLTELGPDARDKATPMLYEVSGSMTIWYRCWRFTRLATNFIRST